MPLPANLAPPPMLSALGLMLTATSASGSKAPLKARYSMILALLKSKPVMAPHSAKQPMPIWFRGFVSLFVETTFRLPQCQKVKQNNSLLCSDRPAGRLTSVTPELAKARTPMNSTESGIVTFFRSAQPSKAEARMQMVPSLTVKSPE